MTSQDSIKLGEVVKYALTYKHDPKQEVLFPDSTYDFYPFEYVSKEYFPTVTDAEGSLDSVVYELRTFEMDSLYELRLPVYLAIDQTKQDSIISEADGLFFKEMITEQDSTFDYKKNTELAEVNQQFNYPYLLIFLGVLVVLAVILLLVFGKKIKHYYLRKRLEKKHEKFVAEYEQLLSNGVQAEAVDHAVGLWKVYVGDLKGEHLQTFTTKELKNILKEADLIKALQTLDRLIYAGQHSDEEKDSLELLKQNAVDTFNQKIEELQHG